jgi:hypothetical protein
MNSTKSKKEKEIARVRNGRRRRKEELNELRRLKAFMKLVVPDKVDEFYRAETVNLNKMTALSESPKKLEVPPGTSTDMSETIDEMITTYNVQLSEFDSLC